MNTGATARSGLRWIVWLRAYARPEDFQCQLELIEAQIACVEHRHADAGPLFEAAIQHVQRHSYLQIEAVVAKAAVPYCRRRGLNLVARSCLCHARHTFMNLGAPAKVCAMDLAPASDAAATFRHT